MAHSELASHNFMNTTYLTLNPSPLGGEGLSPAPPRHMVERGLGGEVNANDRPIKVMHIIARLNIGGAALYVIELVSRLKEAGYDSQLVCGLVGKDEGDMRYIADEKQLPVTIIASLGREISPIGDLLTIY